VSLEEIGCPTNAPDTYCDLTDDIKSTRCRQRQSRSRSAAAPVDNHLGRSVTLGGHRDVTVPVPVLVTEVTPAGGPVAGADAVTSVDRW
jgi:hypothetical protein